MPKIEIAVDDCAFEIEFENTLEGNESAKMVFYDMKPTNVEYMILIPERDNVVGLTRDEIWFE